MSRPGRPTTVSRSKKRRREDVPRGLHHPCRLFTDDSKLIATIKDAQDIILLQNDIDRLSLWASTWEMKFNHPKCKYNIMDHFNKNCVELEFTIVMLDENTRYTLEQITD